MPKTLPLEPHEFFEQLKYRYPELLLQYIKAVILYEASNEGNTKYGQNEQAERKRFEAFLENNFFKTKQQLLKFDNNINLKQYEITTLLSFGLAIFRPFVREFYQFLICEYDGIIDLTANIVSILPLARHKECIKNIETKFPNEYRHEQKSFIGSQNQHNFSKSTLFVMQTVFSINLGFFVFNKFNMIAPMFNLNRNQKLLPSNTTTNEISLDFKNPPEVLIFPIIIAAVVIFALTKFFSFTLNSFLNFKNNRVKNRILPLINKFIEFKPSDVAKETDRASNIASSSNISLAKLTPVAYSQSFSLVMHPEYLSEKSRKYFQKNDTILQIEQPETSQASDLSSRKMIAFKKDGPQHPLITNENDYREGDSDTLEFLIILSEREHNHSKYYIAIPNDIYTSKEFSPFKVKFIGKILRGDMELESENNKIKFLVVKAKGKDGKARLYINQEKGLQSNNIPIRVATLFSDSTHTGSGRVHLRKIPTLTNTTLSKL